MINTKPAAVAEPKNAVDKQNAPDWRVIMIAYLNKDQRENYILLNLLDETLKDLIKDKNFQFASKDLKSARSFTERAFNAIESNLDKNELQKVGKLARVSRISITQRTNPQTDEVVVPVFYLENLAEKVIAGHCVGCTREDWRNCEIKRDLEETHIPGVVKDSRHGCKYSQ
ncbi:MAG TPA: DUF5651 domain-containing protein [Candidatus Bathyarchaeia archaeon]|nr:DUF5651 domain-containing protein [Candidatus Bathyarchaeia archaeon]